jgi:hypothetical protein
LREEIEQWEHYDGFDAEAREAIEEANAVRLFPRFARVDSSADSPNQRRLGGAS